MPRALFVSTFFADAVAACGGIAYALAVAGWTTTLLTVFARSERAAGELEREEDLAAAETLRMGDLVWLDDGTRLADRLAPLVATNDIVFAPQALARDEKHRVVRDAVSACDASGERIAWYRDALAIVADPEATSGIAIIDDFRPCCIPLAFAGLARKLDACAAYASLLEERYGGVAAMRATIATLACDEGERFGLNESAEVVAPGSLARGLLETTLR